MNREQHSVSVGLTLNFSEASKGRNDRENTSVWCKPDEFAVGGADWAETHSVGGIFSFFFFNQKWLTLETHSFGFSVPVPISIVH